MRKYCLVTLVALVIAVTLAPPSALAQSGDRTMPMRPPDGQPDVSGIFTFRTLTPFQRPDQFADLETLGTGEASARTKAVRHAAATRPRKTPS